MQVQTFTTQSFFCFYCWQYRNEEVEDTGITGTDGYGRAIATDQVQTVAAKEILVVEYISAGVERGSVSYPAGNMNDLGEIGYTTTDGQRYLHSIPFERTVFERSGESIDFLHASQAICLYVPSRATLFVSVPLIADQTGGAKIDVSGYTTKT